MADNRTVDGAAPVPIRSTVSQTEPPPPDRLVRDTLASLRATEVHIRLLIDRFELARLCDRVKLDGVPVDALVQLAAASEALQVGAGRALAHIEPDLAHTAEQIADLVRASVR